jgi:3-oxoacyl-[acyl-carrier protein] reductase
VVRLTDKQVEKISSAVADLAKQLLAATPLGRFGQPADMGPATVFLASDEAAWITGEFLRVAGGLK